MDMEIQITDRVVLENFSSTPMGIILQIAVTSVGVALGNALVFAAPKVFESIGDCIENIMNDCKEKK